ncbi:MAG: beta-galactosidase [Planctomycetota bacterium]
MSQQVIAMFRVASESDYSDPQHVSRVFANFERPKQLAPDAVERLPFDQLNACLQVAAHAIDELRRQLSGDLVLTPSLDLMRPGLTDNGQGEYEIDGRKVFPSSLIWLPYDLDAKRALGAMGGIFSQLTQLTPRDGGTYDPEVLQGHYRSVARQVENHLSPIVFHLGHAAAPWMKEQNPEILGGARHFTQYDIDSPLVRAWVSSLCEQLLPEITKAAGDVPVVHLLANEPHFSIRQRGWKSNNQLSEITLNKYKDWLEDKYGSIAQLNRVYGTRYRNFVQVDTTNPISPEIRGGPAWYDWCRFNMDRVNEWFTFLKTEVQTHDGKGYPVTIKLLGHAIEEINGSHGIDIEYLTKLQDLNGGDLRVTPPGAVYHGRHEQGLDPKTSWMSRYCTEWLSQSIFLDFTKSLKPDTIFYDSEWHGFSTVSWRDFTLDRDYVRSSFWLAYSHGMSMTNAWMWGRDIDGRLQPKANHYGELSTQPVAVDAYGRVFKELNAHGELVAASVPQRRRFMVYFTQESAIQSEGYTHDLCDIYEALKIRNYAVGFTTPSEIEKLDPAFHLVVAPPAEFIADDSLRQLAAFAEAGGRVVSITKSNRYTKNELGRSRSRTPRLVDEIRIPMGDVITLNERFGQKLDPFKLDTPLDFNAVSHEGKPMYGVFVQQFADPESGELYALVNSISSGSGDLSFTKNEVSDLSFTDVLTGQSFGSDVPIKPWSVYLLKVVEP